MSKILKQPLLALVLLLSVFVQPALADGDAPADNSTATASTPAQAPVQLSWDRVGDRDRSLV